MHLAKAIALLAAALLAGCAAAPEKPQYTTRTCAMTVGPQIDERAYAVILLCEAEEPLKEEAER